LATLIQVVAKETRVIGDLGNTGLPATQPENSLGYGEVMIRDTTLCIFEVPLHILRDHKICTCTYMID